MTPLRPNIPHTISCDAQVYYDTDTQQFRIRLAFGSYLLQDVLPRLHEELTTTPQEILPGDSVPSTSTLRTLEDEMIVFLFQFYVIEGQPLILAPDPNDSQEGISADVDFQQILYRRTYYGKDNTPMYHWITISPRDFSSLFSDTLCNWLLQRITAEDQK